MVKAKNDETSSYPYVKVNVEGNLKDEDLRAGPAVLIRSPSTGWPSGIVWAPTYSVSQSILLDVFMRPCGIVTGLSWLTGRNIKIWDLAITGL